MGHGFHFVVVFAFHAFELHDGLHFFDAASDQRVTHVEIGQNGNDGEREHDNIHQNDAKTLSAPQAAAQPVGAIFLVAAFKNKVAPLAGR